MDERQILIDQMVSDISSHALRLDEVRLQGFLRWLEAHGSRMKHAIVFALDHREGMEVRFKNTLKGWLEPMPIAGLLWEYHLLLNEIAWHAGGHA
jgi:hypothetical protein